MANITLRTKIDAFLGKRNKSHAWLAGELGISPAHLSLILSGQRTPSLDLALRLAEFTGIEAREFVGAA